MYKTDGHDKGGRPCIKTGGHVQRQAAMQHDRAHCPRGQMKRLFSAFGFIVLFALAAIPAAAQYPAKPVRLLVGLRPEAASTSWRGWSRKNWASAGASR
jgi:hypothetical protein